LRFSNFAFDATYSTGGRMPPCEKFEYVLNRFLTRRGFRCMDCLHACDRSVSEMLAWRREGRMIFRQAVIVGLTPLMAILL
jgi:hypothetical protein